MANVILSTIGTSLLNTVLSDEERQSSHRGWLVRHANEKDLAAPDRDFAGELAARAAALLDGEGTLQIRRASAELNGLYAFYSDHPGAHVEDVHILVTSDTALGRLAASTVQKHLQKLGHSTILEVPRDLSAAGTAAFEGGAKELIRWCADCLPGYRQSGYRVIFNLVGAFKALQGYLNTIGMFYADQILYLFEGSQEPLLIPRLPIAIDLDAVKAFSLSLALMAEGTAVVPLSSVQGIGRAFYDADGKDAVLSAWGLLIWQQIRHEILGGDLLDFPRLKYSDSFRRDTQRFSATERVAMQSKLAEVSARLLESDGNVAVLKGTGGIQYDNYTSKRAGGQPIGHFRISRSVRVSCVAEDGGLTLRHVGAHDFVNDNP